MLGPSPLLGYNTNVRHKGKLYHIQTEDSGVKRPHIITHLFADGGRIVASKKTSYAEHVGAENYAATVKKMMQEQHKAMFIALRDGVYDASEDAIAAAQAAKEGKPPPEPMAAKAEPDAAKAHALPKVPAPEKAPEPPKEAAKPTVSARASRTGEPPKPARSMSQSAVERVKLPDERVVASSTSSQSTPGARQPSPTAPRPQIKPITGAFAKPTDPMASPGAYVQRGTGELRPGAGRVSMPQPERRPDVRLTMPRSPMPGAAPPKGGKSADVDALERAAARLAAGTGKQGAVRRQSEKPPSTPAPGTARYATTQPAQVVAKPARNDALFGNEVLSEKTLDEVILSYLAEDLEDDR